MSKSLLVFFFIFISTALLFCSSPEILLFDYVDRCDLIIQGELTHIDYYAGEVEIENINSMRDTAYIKISKIYKNNSNDSYQDQENVKLLMPTKYGRTRAGYIVTHYGNIFHQIGQNGIWLLEKKDNAYFANNYQSFHPNSSNELIEDLCKIKPQVLKFLKDIHWSNYFEVEQELKLSNIDPNDPIFCHNETNPILIAVKYRKIEIIQDIIDFGFNLNFKNTDNENALFIAIKNSTDDLGIIEILLKNNIEMDILNKQNFSIYDLANKKKNKKEILELFQEYKD